MYAESKSQVCQQGHFENRKVEGKMLKFTMIYDHTIHNPSLQSNSIKTSQNSKDMTFGNTTYCEQNNKEINEIFCFDAWRQIFRESFT